MEIVADKVTEEWLVAWEGELDWDENNLVKLSKHQVTIDDIEHVFWDIEFFYLGKVKPPEDTDWNEDRHICVGERLDKKVLAIIWTKRDNRLRPISCRRARKNEERAYNERK